jgi:hypothetical protein
MPSSEALQSLEDGPCVVPLHVVATPPSRADTRAPVVDLRSRTDYVHLLPGRIRVRVPETWRDPEAGALLESGLSQLSGVQTVCANELTGNVLVHYDAEAVDAQQVLAHIVSLGFLHPARVHAPAPPVPARRHSVDCPGCGLSFRPGSAPESESVLDHPLVRRTFGIVASNLLEFALKRAVLALL